MNELDDFFDAYDHAHTLGAEAADWRALRRNVRRSLLRPALALLGSVALLIAGVALGWAGHFSGWLLAGGLVLAVIPDRLQRLRASRERVAGLDNSEDLRAHLLREARLERAGAFVSALVHAAVSLLFLGTGLIAALLGKDYRPGLISALIVALLAAYHLLWRLPRVSRQCASLGEKVGGKSDEEHGDRTSEASS
ncbi:MAG: hypothetical protein RL885_15860 [Planctomycetota bacterium]